MLENQTISKYKFKIPSKKRRLDDNAKVNISWLISGTYIIIRRESKSSDFKISFSSKYSSLES